MPDNKKNNTLTIEVEVSENYKDEPNFIDIKINQYPKEPALHGVETGNTTEIIVNPNIITINNGTKEVTINKDSNEVSINNKEQQPPDNISVEKNNGNPFQQPTTNPYK